MGVDILTITPKGAEIINNGTFLQNHRLETVP